MKRSSFTLVELMIAITILSLLLSYSIPTYYLIVNKAKVSQCFTNRKNVEKVMEFFKNENGYYEYDIGKLLEKGYLSEYPKCSAGGVYVWISTEPPILGCSIHYWYQKPQPPFLPPQPQQSQKYTDLIYPFTWDDIATMSGKWDIKDGILYNIGTNVHNLFFKINNSSGVLSDFTAKIDFNTYGNFGVYYRTNENVSNPTGYLFFYSVSTRKLLVYDVVNGTKKTILASVNIPSGFSPIYQNHNVEINVKGDKHVISIDGKVYLNFNDKKYTVGNVGLYTSSKKTEFISTKIEEL